ncbi:MAG: hypothetical protein DWP97_06565 [Calditrichaeota bacterium]|nr:MAG: hypothetical protein DWP97_06565 [Calditrichota bacterium]
MRSRNRQIFESNGEIFFVTSTIVGFINIFNRNEYAEILIENLNFYQKRGDFVVLAFVIMPNHFHFIVKTNSMSISNIIGNFKRYTSKQITRKLLEQNDLKLIEKLYTFGQNEPSTDSKIWKPRFDCFTINNIETLKQKIEYIHFNPVKKGIVNTSEDWKYSSAVNYKGGEGLVEVDTEWKCLGY